MARINVLPKNIAELIAAGEVVERPASVIKELVENSIDAGSTVITVEIKNGGVTYMRVTDNGHGIYHEDVPKAFISHATSKVSTAEDLNSIFTLGFRGEALASVAAVSRTEILTKTSDEEFGTLYVIEGGDEISYDFAGCPDGTTIIVRDLFFNTPARMKFLKKDVSEANAVADLLDKLALSHPEISFRLIRDGKQVLITPGDNKLISAIHAVFGKSFADTLIETDYELDGIKIKGLVCKPINARASRAMQFFFLNGRYIKSKACIASLENAYKNSMMVGKFPACILNLTVPLHCVDVNVHPTKTEVRFSDERKIYSAVYYAVKTSIENLDTRPKLDLTKVVQKAAVKGTQLQMEEKKTDSFLTAKAVPKKNFWSEASAKDFNRSVSVEEPENNKKNVDYTDMPDLVGNSHIFKSKPVDLNVIDDIKEETDTEIKTKTMSVDSDRTVDDLPDLLIQATEIKAEASSETNKKIEIREEPAKAVRYIGEAFKTYILCEYDGRLCLIDKHAAHERIIFNRLKNDIALNKSQMLLSSSTVTLSKNEYDAVIDNLEVFEKSGFVIEDFGNGSVIIRECPMVCEPMEAQDLIMEIAGNLISGKTDTTVEKIDMMLHTSACKAAIKAGNTNNPYELQRLAEQVLSEDDIRYCPHGRPVLIELTRYDIEKQFKRIQ